ncbi:M6 family metalloprotease domain-containing protein, partial [bacterium]|nr:M6 family metalloprotease domain-containing protein [bacterium]
QIMKLKQPDGERVEVRVHGDGWYARIESLDGYTLIRDPETRVICFADLASDGRSFVSTGIRAGQAAPGWLTPGLELPLDVRTHEREKVRQRFLAEEMAMLADKSRDPQPSNQGDVLGLTLIIDFSDEPGTIPAADFEAYLNEEGYGGYGNNGSVRDYFRDVSGGALNYTNWVPAQYIRAPQPKSYYEDPSVQFGTRGRELVVWALDHLDAQGHDFSVYDANDDGYIDAVNVFYAGYPDGGWSVGLWPHSWVMNFYADGLSSFKYQITNIGDSLRLSTFCHENGHMIMFWPDLYDYGYESSGVGGFCLMCSSGAGTNPVKVCAYLRAEAGWQTPVELTGLQTGLEASAAGMNIYKVPYAGYPNEYYLIENRQRTGRDASLPAPGGLAIWHVDENGSNDNEQQLPGQHYECTLVQADGRWDLERGNNNGDATDLWYAPSYTQFDPTTTPPATWWDGTDAPLYVDNVSASGPLMTFDFREALGTMAVTVQPQPDGLLAPWTLEGPNGYLVEGEGFESRLVWDEGTYTLTWGDVPGWTEPDPIAESFELVEGGAPAVFVGTYSDPPFATVATGVAEDPGAVRGVTALDHDGDGDLDLHVVNDGTSDVLLRNDGGFQFNDITPAGLAVAGAGRAAAWADYDNDGDLDLYLVRAGATNLMLEQDAGTFQDVTALSYGLDNDGPGADAQWTDYDRDGLIDLLLVQDGTPNLLFRNFGDLGSGHPMLLSQSDAVIQDAAAGQSAVWCDFDRDGDRDVYMINAGAANVLASNYDGIGFDDAAQGAVTSTADGRDAAWGDFDNDGDWDLYLANDGQADAYYRMSGGLFQNVAAPAVNDDGAGRAVAAADFDNDGVLDLYVARRNADDILLFGDGAGGFLRASLGLGDTAGASESLVCADFDDDGGVDVYVGRDGEPNVMLRNMIQDRGHWLGIELVGGALNTSAVGATVRVVTGETSQLRELTAGDGRGEVAPILHLGLGDAAVADSVIVTWTDGEQTVRTGVSGDQVLTVPQDEDTTPAPDAVPAVTRLHAAYPNPFNPSTTIVFELARRSPVRLDVYGLDGRLVASLLREDRAAGRHHVVWQGRDGQGRPVASGTYLCRLRTEDTISSQRLTLVK